MSSSRCAVQAEAMRSVGMPFAVEPLVRDGIATLVVSGDVDVESSPLLMFAARDILAYRPYAVVIDLSAVGYIEPAGLRALMLIRWGVESFDAEFRVRVPAPLATLLGGVPGLSGAIDVQPR